jgi:hypothetical protein
MEITSLPTVLSKFLQQVTPVDGRFDRPLTVNDLRLSLRGQRMSEVRDWSNGHLDVIEVHAARFDADAPLECVLNFPSEGDQVALAATASEICSPSPFAWT